MYKFNNNNIITGYIKQLLHSFNLPKCHVFNTEKEFKEFYPSEVSAFGIVKKYKDNKDYICFLNSGKVNGVAVYSFGKYYKNITTTFNLYNAIYDSRCHEYFGEYLRFLRDYKGLDLMSFYNCFSDNILVDEQYKYIVVPVKHNTKYTVALNGNEYSTLLTYNSHIDDIINEFRDAESLNKLVPISSSFVEPYVLETSQGQDKQIDSGTNSGKIKYAVFNEQNYRLVIRLNLDNDTPITILEGDYTKTSKDFVKVKANFDDTLDDGDYNQVDIQKYFGGIQLLKVHYGQYNTSYPFADKLIEYITDMVILPNDPISDNIIDAKYKANLRYGFKSININNLKSSFTNRDRLGFLDIYSQTKFDPNDSYGLLGYVDKNIERCLDDESKVFKEVK